MKKVIYILGFFIIVGVSSCGKNCNKNGVVNVEGTCTFSSYVMFCNNAMDSGVNIFPLLIYMDGKQIGHLATAVADTPQTCSSAFPDTILLTGTLVDDTLHTWTAISENHPTIFYSRQIYSNNEKPCQVIRIH